jgi:hypothetical protein
MGISLAASFCGFFSTAAEAEGGGTGGVISFAAPSSLGKINRVKQSKYKEMDKTSKIIKTKRKNLRVRLKEIIQRYMWFLGS